MLAPPDPAAQLVELGDAEAVGVEDHHDRGVRDVDADLDHRRRDEHVELAGAESGHRRLLLGRREPPVEQPEPQPGELTRRQPLAGVERRGDLELLALLDEGADDVGLSAGGDLLAHVGPHPSLGVLALGRAGLDRGAAGRELVEHADVEVAVDGHRRRARDRGGGHHEGVGRAPGAVPIAQGRALLDAEAVLLVDHHDAERRERHPLLDQRVGADREVDGAVGQPGEHVAPLGARHLVGEQLDADRAVAEQVGRVGHAHPLEQAGDADRVLLGQHLGRRHERRLVTALDRGEHRRDGDDGLARPDVALEQAVHRVRGGEIGVDLADHPLLRAGERVTEGGPEPLDELAGRGVGDAALLALQAPLAQDEGELHAQQLVEREAVPGDLLLPHRLREVDATQRRRPVGEAVLGAKVVGQRVGDAPLGAAAQRLLHPAGELPRRELRLLALGVDRDDPPGAVADEVDDRVRHLEPAPVGVGLAEEGDLQALGQLALAPRLVEEHDVHPARVVADRDVHHAPPVAGPARARRAHGRQHERLLARDQVGDARLAGAVDPATGVRGDEVEHRLDADLLERRLLLRPDPTQALDGDRRQVAERDRLGHRRHARALPGPATGHVARDRARGGHGRAAATRRRRGRGRAAGRRGAPRPRRRGGARRARR